MKACLFFTLLVLGLAAVHGRRYQTSDVNCAGEYVKCMETETQYQPAFASKRCKDKIRNLPICAPHAGNPEVGAPPPGMRDCGAESGGNDC